MQQLVVSTANKKRKQSLVCEGTPCGRTAQFIRWAQVGRLWVNSVLSLPSLLLSPPYSNCYTPLKAIHLKKMKSDYLPMRFRCAAGNDCKAVPFSAAGSGTWSCAPVIWLWGLFEKQNFQVAEAVPSTSPVIGWADLPVTSPPAWSSWPQWLLSVPTPSSRSPRMSPVMDPGWRCRHSAFCSHQCSWHWCNRSLWYLDTNHRKKH